MPTLLTATSSDIQFLIDTEYARKFAPEIQRLYPRFVTRRDPGKTEWVGLMCRHPEYTGANPLDPPKAYILVGYPFGQRHEWLLWANRNQGDWTRRRVELIVRLLFKRLAIEVRKCSPPKQSDK